MRRERRRRGGQGGVQVGEAERRGRRHGRGVAAAIVGAAVAVVRSAAIDTSARRGVGHGGVRGLLGFHVHEAEEGTVANQVNDVTPIRVSNQQLLH